MRCPMCRKAEVETSEVRSYQYRESGLDGVFLFGISVNHCPECGGRLVAIPNIEGLHRAIAVALVVKKGRLTPAEVRFLRKSLGWSGSDFARKMHTSPQQVSRWESRTAPVLMSKPNELLLRALVALGERVEDYPETIETVLAGETPEPAEIRLRNREGRWQDAA